MSPSSNGGVSIQSRIPGLRRMVKVGVALGCLSLAASLLNDQSLKQGGVSVIWLSNGLLIGVLLCAPRVQWPAFLALGYLVDLCVNVVLNNQVPLSAYLSLCNMIEVLVAAFLMYRSVSRNPDLTQPRQIRSFLLYGVLLAPLLASVLSLYGFQMQLGASFMHALQIWFAADVLGVATITPLYLSYHHRRRFSQRSALETSGLFLLLVTVSVWVFGFAPTPLVWLVLLLLILLGARVGFTGAALGLLLVLFIGGYCTAIGRGPLSYSTHGTLSGKMLMFQVFVFTAMLALYLTEVAMAKNNRTRLGLEASETRFRLLAEASRDMIVLARLNGEREYVSPAATELLGWTEAELLQSTYREITHPEDLARLEEMLCACREGKETGTLSYRCLKKDGSYLWMESNMRLFHDAETAEPAGFVYILRDISERKMAESKLQDAFQSAERLAMVDGLTGIGNRRLLDETLGREWARAIRDGTFLSLLLIDVDHFKSYNDIYGHLAGDRCLQRIANAVQDVLRRPPDLLARYGGEEFVIVLPNTPRCGAELMAEKVMKAVERCAVGHTGSPYGSVTVSLGCATMTATLATDTNDLLRAADLAMYRAKSDGRNRMQMAGDELVLR